MSHEILFTEEAVPFTITIVTVIPAIEPATMDMANIMVMFTEDELFL